MRRSLRRLCYYNLRIPRVSQALLQQLMKTEIGAQCTTDGRKQNRNRSKSWMIREIKYRQNITCWNCNQKGHFQNQCSKLVAFRNKEVNMAAGDSDDGLVCRVEITVEDHIMDSRASFHATYCKEELERFKLRSDKVRLVDDKTLDIAGVRDVVLKTSFGKSWTLKDVRWFGEAEEAFLHNVREDKETAQTTAGVEFGVAERLSRTFRAESTGLRVEAPKMLWADSVSTSYLIYRIPYVPIGLHILEKEWRGKDTSLAHLKAATQMKCDIAIKIRRATRLSEAEISHLWTRFMESVAKHGLSSENHSEPMWSLDMSEGSKNSRSFEDSGRLDEEDTEYGASSNEGGSETPRVQMSTRESRASVSKESIQWKKVINEEMVSLEKNQTCSLVRLPANKKASQSLWMFKVKEEHNRNERYEAPLSIVAAGAFLCSDMTEFNKPKWLVFKMNDRYSEKQVGDEREVEVLRSFNKPSSELITEDRVLPERERLYLSPPKHSKEKYNLDTATKLSRAKPNSEDVDLSKDKSCLESPLELRRSWYVEGHIRSGVISSVLMQQCQRTIRQRYSPCEGPLSLEGHLGDEGLCSGGTKLNSIFITAEVTFIKLKQPRTMIKEHDQQAKMRATPRKLAYADSDKEAPDGSLAKGFSDRFSLESSGTSDTRKQTRSTIKSQKTPSKNKEPTHLRRSRRLEDRSTTREKARRERSKSRRKRSGHQDTSSDSEYKEGSDDACEELNSPYKRPKPTPFSQRINHFKYHKRAKLPRNIRVYEGNKDPQKFLEEFSQQKRYTKDPTEIHGIKRRQNEGLQAFMDRFKSESSHIKGVPPVLRISAFMHGHGHPELAKKFNDKIPKTMDEMFERVRAFIRGEVAAGSAEMVHPSQGDKRYVRPEWTGGPERARNRGGPREARRNMGVYTPYPRKDTFTPLTKTPKEILAMESVSFPEPPPLIETPEKQNLNKFYDYHGDIGHNTNDCYQLKKKIEEVVALGKVAHLVKDIHQNNQRDGNPGRNSVKVINMIRHEGNRKRSFEERRSGVMNELTFSAIPQSQLTDEPIILKGIVEGNQVRRILVDGGSSSKIMYEHCFRNLGVNIRSRLRRCRIPMIGFSGETYHPLGLIDLRVTLGKEGRSKRVQGLCKEVQWCQREEQMSRIREQVILRTKSNSGIGPTSDLMSLKKTWDRENAKEAFTISNEHPDQYLTMGTTLTTNCKQLLANVLQENREVFAWTGSERTTVPRFVMEHQLKIYPLAKPVVHKRLPMASEGRLALKEKVFH
ncbi:reverse transcriptase domain-containing protein [Tanacetum coccineum]